MKELTLVAVLFLAYKSGRLAADGHVERAFETAHDVWHLERMLRWPSEDAVQDLLLRSAGLTEMANSYYAWVHFPATGLFLVWMYWRKRRHYYWVRRVMVLLTAAALVVHLVAPLAPPRMLAEAGMVDTGRIFGPSVYGAPGTDSMANQYAAMPSLHVGWAVVVAVGLIAVSRCRWRWLWLIHPLVTLLVVVGTANHYWLDAVVACVLLAGSFGLAVRPRPDAAAGRKGDREAVDVMDTSVQGRAPEPATGGGGRLPRRHAHRMVAARLRYAAWWTWAALPRPRRRSAWRPGSLQARMPDE
ncbi:phosphatase PAP2 family protein [Streptomyces sp. NPDC012935]|uniref:phosphatase PAP2 family protein n=1 Tax=Streptomyces sp. NPDC012935 TaxID=3364857 RepID=UPI0036CC7F01